ncbi:MAG: BLUF domain-containing protein [Hylemonella sp.]|nr:BLUF domain-containing protein [Hylemonella sp.]
MPLVRTVYVSTVADSKDSAALPQIMKLAQANNEVHNLTGLLVFNHKYYLQVIEGGRKAVNSLLSNLYRDPRHVDMMVLGLEEITQRAFPDWGMQFVPAASATREIMLRNGVAREFDPYGMSAASALGFLRDMHGVALAKSAV